MPRMQLVTCRGGPLDGKRRHVRSYAQIVTFEWEQEQHYRDWDGLEVYATRIGVATYQRDPDDPTVFRYVRTPTAVGDHDLRFYDELEENER